MALKQLVTTLWLLISCLFLLSSCAPPPTTPPLQTSLFLYRFTPPAFIEYSADFQPLNEIPFQLPPDCGLYGTFPAPVGRILAVELSCPGGQTILFLDIETGAATQPVTDTDAHFLDWTSDGEAAYVKVDALSNPKVFRVFTDETRTSLAIDGFTYDLAAKPDSRDFTFTFSRGLGFGSEIHLAQNNGRNTQQLYADPYHYISFARFSPAGGQIAFLKIPDTQTPFTIGALWVMDSDGANARKLADADGGHGYAANWSPDGTKIALVVRENPEDEAADQSSEALLSNIYVIHVETGALTQITHFAEGYAGTPFWSPDGNTLSFDAVINGRMTVAIAETASGETRFLETEPACCPAWMRR